MTESHSDLQRLFRAAVEHHRARRLDEAADFYRQVLALKPDLIDAHLNLGAILKDQGRLNEAALHLGEALAVDPNFAEAHYNLGLVLKAQGRLDEAAACYYRALDLRPDDAAAHSNLGVALMDRGRLDEAESHCRRAVELRPSAAMAHHNLAVALKEQGRLNEAASCCRQALSIDSTYVAAYNTMGIVFKEQGKPGEAEECFDRALALLPDFAQAHYNLGGLLKDQGRLDESIGSYRRALALKPNFTAAKFALCMAQLPPLYENDAELEIRRASYRDQLETLCDDPSDLANGVGASQPFYLAYQGRNDRELQSLYGRLVCRAMAKHYPPASLARRPLQDEAVRVGIVSGYFYHHANWNMPIKGWLSRLDRQKFRLFGYHTGAVRDLETAKAAALCERFVQGPLPTDLWREAILADAPHVLIYPEVGMDPAAARLAAQRLAPIQCNSWGHPDTSGFPTLNYYLSSDLMEPTDGQNHYTERLVRLPNLSVYCEPPDRPAVQIGRPELGLKQGATVYWCGQSLYKYLPEFDDVFPRIAQGAGDCQFAFIEFPGSPSLTELFRNRLRRAFARFGLNADEYCVFLPRLNLDRFTATIGQCDIVLDSIGWSGCNSLLECVTQDRPIVTMAGGLMRGRHGMAILTMMGVTDIIANDIDSYVSIAIRLARETEWRTTLRKRISENKHLLYRDDSCISALEDFLERVVRNLD